MKKITFNQISFAQYAKDDVSVALRSSSGDYGGGSEVLIVYGLDVSPGTFFAGTAFDETSITLKACGGEQPILMSDRKGHNGITEDGTATTLTAQEKERPVIETSIVRRLTPMECERLQGFPDGWTDIGEWTDSKGKRHKEADSPRYKALGNSIALPFWEYLARRICAQYERPVTMASLFDGIGGFPLAFERAGAKAVWASEIEAFPIAVTKIRFPEKETDE